MTQEEMNILVPQKLHEIVEKENIEVLWACESGSRAWGFASADSDFDVRFIYRRKPPYYMKLNPGRDVIELPVDDTWDVSGWDLDKTLKLLERANPTLYEWMNSPIVYIETDFRKRLQPLMRECFSEKRMLYHYVNTAKSNMKHHLASDHVVPKKYFYVLRPVLACRWIMKYHKAPPVLFETLLNEVLPEGLTVTVSKLLTLKISGPEKMTISPIEELSSFLTDEIRNIEAYLSALPENPDDHWDALNRFFLQETGLGEFAG